MLCIVDEFARVNSIIKLASSLLRLNSTAANPPHWTLKIFPRSWSEYLPDSRSASPFRKNKIMMRMGLIVVGLSTLTVMELGTPSRTKTSASDPFERLTVDVSVSSDTLERADRLEIHHLPHEEPFHASSPVEPTSPQDGIALVPRDSRAVELGANNKKDAVRKLKPRLKNTDSNEPRPNRTNSNKAPKTERSKAIVEVKPCRPNAFDRLLQVLNLSSKCQI
jgi:hypothetical protein